MRILFLIFFSFFIQNVFFAQQELNFKKVAQSKPISLDKYESFLTKPIQTKDGIFYVKGKHRNYMLVKLSDDLKVFRQKKIKLKTNRRKHRFEFVIQLNEKILLFSSFVNKSINKRSLVYQEVNTATLEVSDASEPIVNVGLRVINDSPGTFNFEFSPDKSKVIFYSHKWKNDKRKVKISINVCDSNLNTIWTVDDFLVKKEYGFKMKYGHPVIDNLGNVHFLKRISKKQGLTFNTYKGEYDFYIFSFLENGRIQKSNNIIPNEKKLVELFLKVTSNQDLIGMGFFNTKDPGHIDGIAHITFNKNGLPLNKQMIFSPVDSYSENTSLNQNEPFKSKILPFYNIKNIIEKPSGNLVLIAEDSNIKSYGNYSSYLPSSKNIGSNESSYYYHGEMIIIENKKNGNPNWIFRIPKFGREEYNKIGNQSFLFLQNGGRLTFIFNDHPEKLTKMMRMPRKKSHISIANIDTNGNTLRNLLFPNEQPIRQRFTIIPSGKIAENEFIIFKYDRLLKLKIE